MKYPFFRWSIPLFGLFLFTMLVCALSGNKSAAVDLTNQSIKAKSEPLPIIPGDFSLPMHIHPLLSGNFGELRNNHFHSGLDFKTNGQTGIPVYAVADGWLSRIRIEAYGFGKALYLDHPNGFTTVYGHLDRFAPPFDSLSLAIQYQHRSFDYDTVCQPGKFRVKKGQLIAFSGNTGSSAAPHLHFEIRNTKSESIIDPLLWYGNRIIDTRSPKIRAITLYASEGEGIIQGGLMVKTLEVKQTVNNSWVVSSIIPAVHGKIGIGIKAYDYMDETSNIYGVYRTDLFGNESLLMHQQLDSFSYDDTRYLNACINYESWVRSKSQTMNSFRLPGNHWPALKTNQDDGYITVPPDSTVNLRYELIDRAGNRATLQFKLTGQALPIPAAKPKKRLFRPDQTNTYKDSTVEFILPAGSLYQAIDFSVKHQTGSPYSDAVSLQDRYTPIHKAATIKIKLKQIQQIKNQQLYLALKQTNGIFSYLTTGSCESGWLVCKVKTLGTFTVLSDTLSPKITPINLEKISKNHLIRIRVTDQATGIKTWDGFIDDQWVLFELEPKTALLSCNIEKFQLTKNRQHRLKLKVTDHCGNSTMYEHSFYY